MGSTLDPNTPRPGGLAWGRYHEVGRCGLQQAMAAHASLDLQALSPLCVRVRVCVRACVRAFKATVAACEQAAGANSFL